MLGADDGIISTASLVLGVASATAARNEILLAGVAGLVAGAMSMAAGEYVSVSSQSDTENADLARERRELAAQSRERQPVSAAFVAAYIVWRAKPRSGSKDLEEAAIDLHCGLVDLESRV